MIFCYQTSDLQFVRGSSAVSGGHHFNGILGSATLSGDVLTVRIYPWLFEPDPGLEPVFQLSFREPRFNSDVLKPYELEEIDVEAHADRVDIWAYADGKPTTLAATSVTVTWEAYKPADFHKRIEQLDGLLEQSDTALANALARIDGAKALIAELVRRSQIKANASADLQTREAAVTSALQRVLKKLSED